MTFVRRQFATGQFVRAHFIRGHFVSGQFVRGQIREGTLRQRTIPEGTIRDRTLRNGTLRDRTLREGSRDGVVVRALASHQCDQDFDSRTGRYHVARACCWFCSLLREVFLRVLRFSPLIKTNTFKFQFDPECSHVWYMSLWLMWSATTPHELK